MALQKEITWNGITLDYWRITQIEDYRTKGIMKISIGGYTNKEHRDGGNKELYSYHFNVSGDKYKEFFDTAVLDMENNNVIKNAYSCIRSLGDVSVDPETQEEVIINNVFYDSLDV